MTNNDELIERAADSLEFLESTGGGKRVQAQVIRDLATALRAADRRIAELERLVRRYANEYASPVPDYTLRNTYRKELFAAMTSEKEKTDGHD